MSVKPGEPIWISVKECPVCGREGNFLLGKLAVEKYSFGDEHILLPPEGIRLNQCGNCGLVFKSILPSPEFLAEVFSGQAGRIWAGDYDFSDEVDYIRSLTSGEDFDLLDVGASNGGLLKAFATSEGRRSALDIIKHPHLRGWLQGEFIYGFAESEALRWSEQPYDVVSLFDVIEHLYDPHQAFSNLRALVKPGGIAVVETGDAESCFPQKFGVHRWWYACLLEHHVFWTKESLEYIASKNGFHLIDFQRKRHKQRSAVRLKQHFATVTKTLLHRISPTLQVKLARKLGKSVTRPWSPFGDRILSPCNHLWSPFTRDHFRAVLRRDT